MATTMALARAAAAPHRLLLLHGPAAGATAAADALEGLMRQARHLSTEVVPASATQPSTSGRGAASYLPKWLSGLLPGGGSSLPAPNSPIREQPEQKSTVGATQGRSLTEDDKKELKERIEDLRTMKDMDVDGYVRYCQQMRASLGGIPRPYVPPVPPNHPDYIKYGDEKRIQYMRLLQHEKIGSAMTAEQKERLLLGKADALVKDKAFLNAVAQQTGIYIDLEVRDLVTSYHDMKKKGERLLRYVEELGYPFPEQGSEQRDAIEFMEAFEKSVELEQSLARRDRTNCPMSAKLPWIGRSAKCELTGLLYSECCGARAAPIAQVTRYKQEQEHKERMEGWERDPKFASRHDRWLRGFQKEAQKHKLKKPFPKG